MVSRASKSDEYLTRVLSTRMMHQTNTHISVSLPVSLAAEHRGGLAVKAGGMGGGGRGWGPGVRVPLSLLDFFSGSSHTSHALAFAHVYTLFFVCTRAHVTVVI